MNRNRKILIENMKKMNLESYILIFFFIAISISVFQAKDIVLFVSKYLSILLSIVVYINATFFGAKTNKYVYAIFSTWVITNLANELLLLVNPNLYLSLMSNFLTNKELIIVKDQIFRSRLTISTYTEIFLPILYWFYFTFKKNRFLSLIQIIIINILAFYSGWRTRVIICIISLLEIKHIYRMHIKKRDLYSKLLVLVVPFIFFSFLHTDFVVNNLTLKRLFYGDGEVMSTNKARVQIIEESIEIFWINPIFGVGLGNNYIYRKNRQISLNPTQNISNALVRESGAHNFYIDLTLDTGLIGLVSFITLLGIWLYEDIKNIKSDSKIPFIFSYYLILFYALFQSIGGFRFFSILFLLRSVIKSKNRNFTD